MKINFIASCFVIVLTLIAGMFAVPTPRTERVTKAIIPSLSPLLVTPTPAIKKEDPRITKLRKFLEYQDSPLADYSEVFIAEADRNNLDWKLVAAISGVESGFGKRIPPYSYNGWGWGVYGTHVYRFSSWSSAIETISLSLRRDYIDKRGATDIYQIGSTYASSPTWANRVIYFMNKIDQFQDPSNLASLSI